VSHFQWRRIISMRQQQMLEAFEHNVAQFQMQIKQESDAAKRAVLEDMLVRERANHKAMSRAN
jgi:hypothetical protein